MTSQALPIKRLMGTGVAHTGLKLSPRNGVSIPLFLLIDTQGTFESSLRRGVSVFHPLTCTGNGRTHRGLPRTVLDTIASLCCQSVPTFVAFEDVDPQFHQESLCSHWSATDKVDHPR